MHEHVIRAANVGDIAILVTAGNVAGSVVTVACGLGCFFRAVHIAEHESRRRRIQHKTNFSFVCLLVVSVKQRNPVSG